MRTTGDYYIRNDDGATMVRVGLGSYVNLPAAVELGLVSATFDVGKSESVGFFADGAWSRQVHEGGLIHD